MSDIDRIIHIAERCMVSKRLRVTDTMANKLIAEIKRLRADRNSVIRECAVAIKHAVHSAIYTVGTREGAAPCDYSEAANEAIEQSILALIEGDE